MIVTWLMSRLFHGGEGLEYRSLFETYRFETLEAGRYEPVNTRHFTLYLQYLYPEAKRIYKKNRVATKTIYSGLSLKSIRSCPVKPEPISCLALFLKAETDCIISESTENYVTCELKTGVYSNGIEVRKCITFNSDGTWCLKVSGETTDLAKAQIDSNFQLSKEGVMLVLNIVEKLGLCSAIDVGFNGISVSRYHRLEDWQVGDSPCERKLRTLSCMRILIINSVDRCLKCQKMIFEQNIRRRPRLSDEG